MIQVGFESQHKELQFSCYPPFEIPSASRSKSRLCTDGTGTCVNAHGIRIENGLAKGCTKTQINGVRTCWGLWARVLGQFDII